MTNASINAIRFITLFFHGSDYMAKNCMYIFNVTNSPNQSVFVVNKLKTKIANTKQDIQFIRLCKTKKVFPS